MANTNPAAGTRSPSPDAEDTAMDTPIEVPASDYSPDYLSEYSPAPEDPRMPAPQPPHLPHLLRSRGPRRDAAPPKATHSLLPQPGALRSHAQLLFLIVLFVVLIVIAWELTTGGWHF
jgi:hypothetical protein